MGEGTAGWATPSPEGVIEFAVTLGAMIGEVAICAHRWKICAGRGTTCAALETTCVDRGIFVAQEKACGGRRTTCVDREIACAGRGTTCAGQGITCVDRETSCAGRGKVCADLVTACAPVVVLREFPHRRVAVTTCTGTIDETGTVMVMVVVDPLRVALGTFPRGCGVVRE